MQALNVSDIYSKKLECLAIALVKPGKVLKTPTKQIVNHPNVSPAGKQAISQIRPDKTGPSSHNVKC
jgi:hypothetical protein